MAHNDISDITNYLDYYVANPHEILVQYFEVMTLFITQSIESVSISNIKYFKHIILKGLENITHVFRMILLYTRNLDIAVYNSKKSVYYFIEFIGQIGDNNNEYLKLSSTDATLFVYKKTIFSINHEYRNIFNKTNSNNTVITNCLFHMTELWLSAMRWALDVYVTVTNDEVMIALKKIQPYLSALLCLIQLNVDKTIINEQLASLIVFSDAVKTLNSPNTIELLVIMCKKLEKEYLVPELIDIAIVNNADKLTTTSTKRFVSLIVNASKNIKPISS